MQAQAQAPAQTFVQVDNGLTRTVYDLGWRLWQFKTDPQVQAQIRLVLTSKPRGREEGKLRIGRLRAGLVWELFATTCPEQGFSAVDVVSFYFGRGAF